ncbi:745_t:CDS:10 [Paraglomus occultum]|uniref:745_t:CDS:1 n=1 Tax=Paraglomus occultum TaxID=144539 RepID=A0A9N9CEE3_9GLOM|nr:745_t:CDS:10 [Paraglomus occultum]
MDGDEKFPLRSHQNEELYLQTFPESDRQRMREYLAAARKLADLVNDSSGEPFYIQSCRIFGAKKTRQSLFKAVISPTFEARTFGELIDEVRIAADKLNRLDIFKYVDVLLDTCEDGFAPPEALDMVIAVEEKPRYWIRTGTEIGNDAGSANISLNIRNVFGGAETLEAFMSANTQTSHVFEFCLAKPINGNPDYKIDASAFSLTKNNQIYSSHDEILRGAALRWRGRSRLGLHELSYGITWRQVSNIAQNATLSIRESAGHSLKSSITNTFTRDARDDVMLPSKGYYLKLAQEFAGIGGDVDFFKHELESQVNFHLGKGFILSASLRNGLLYPLDGQRSKISDRFFLGGAQSIRGFKLNGIGPREDKKDSLGGDLYVAGGASLFTPLPRLGNYPVKGHFFVNGGNLLQLNQRARLRSNINQLTKTPSISAGVGIVYRSSIVRLEVNFCLPLVTTATDKVKKGLQLGLGINFW